MIKEAIIKLSKKENLIYTEAEEVMNEIMEGKASDVQKSAYLTALSMKGETIDEITASAAGMRAHCKWINPCINKCKCILIKTLSHIFCKYLCCLNCKRTVQIYFEILIFF